MDEKEDVAGFMAFEDEGGAPSSIGEPIQVIGGVSKGELIIYFRPKVYAPSEEEIRARLNGLVYRGECTGYDLTRSASGEIRIFFNPTIHDNANEEEVLGAMTLLIRGEE